MTHRWRPMIRGLVTVLGLAAACGLCRADPPGAPAASPAPDDRVTFAWSAATMREAAALLADKLHLRVVVAEPPEDTGAGAAAAEGAAVDISAKAGPQQRPPDAEPSPAAGAAADPSSKPPPRPVTFRQDRRPLRELLDAMGRAFGYAWEEALGVYVFRPVEAPRAAGDRLVESVRAQTVALTPQAVEGVIAELDGLAIGKDGLPVEGLSPESRGVLQALLASTLLGKLTEILPVVAGVPARVARDERITFDSFARDGRVIILAPDAYLRQLQIRTPSPDKAGEWVESGWFRSPQPPREPAAERKAGTQ